MLERKLPCHCLLLCLTLYFCPSSWGQAALESLATSSSSGRTVALHSSFVRISDGIIIYPDRALSGNTAAVKLQVVADNIIRVTAIPVSFSMTSNATDGNTPDPTRSYNAAGDRSVRNTSPQTNSHPDPDTAFSG